MEHHHSHHHHHENGHAGHHHHAPVGHIGTAFFINIFFTVLEIVGGIMTNSLAILSDALHDAGDTVGLGMSWYMERLSGKGRTSTFSYGYRRFSILAALINANILLIGSIVIVIRAIPRIISPEPVKPGGMLLLAILGIAFNGLAMWRMRKSEGLNARVVRLHFLEDVLGWVAVLIGSIVIYFAHVPVLDPLLSMAIGIYVFFNAARNLWASLRIFLQAVPEELSIADVSQKLQDVPEVISVHDIHLWSMEGTYNVLTAHLVIGSQHSLQDAEHIKERCRHLLEHMDIAHATIEMETEDNVCSLDGC